MTVQLTSDQLLRLISFILSERGHDELSLVAAKGLLALESPGVFLNQALAEVCPPNPATPADVYESLTNVCEQMGLHGHLNATIDLLRNHENWRVRVAAVKALGKIGNPAALPALLEVQSDSAGGGVVRWAAKQSMQTLQQLQHPKPLPGLTLQLTQTERAAACLIAGILPDDFSILGQLLKYDDYQIQSLADQYLSRLRDLDKERFLAALDRNELPPSPGVIQWLGRFRDERGVKYIPDPVRGGFSERLFERRVEQQDRAIKALGEIASVEAIKRLISYLGDPYRYDQHVRSSASQVLLGIDEAVGPLIIHAYDTNSWIRCNEARLVAKLAGLQGLDRFVKALHDRRKLVRESAEEGLVALGESAVPPLLSLISVSDPMIRIHATRALGTIGHESAFDAIVRMVNQASMEERRVAVEALGGFSSDRCVELLSLAIQSKDPETRRRAFKAIGRMTDKRRVEILRTGLVGTNSQIHLEVVRFLGQIKMMEDQQVADLLILALEDERTDVREIAESTLLRIGRPAISPLQEAAKKGLSEARRILKVCDQNEKERMMRLRYAGNIREHLQFAHAAFGPQFPSRKPPSVDMPRPVTDCVQFSVTTPRILVAGQSFVLDVWAYLKRDLAVVIERAREAQSGREARVRIKGPVPIVRQTVMHLALQVPDFGIDNLEDTIYWTGDIGNATFPVNVPDHAMKGSYLGKVSFFVSGLLIAKVDFEMEVGTKQQEADDVTVCEVRPKTAFASYATEDRDEVLARIQGMLKVLPELDIFLDVASLRSGEKWADRLEQEIQCRDIFYLFWSLAASRSQWVEKEWQTALTTKGLEYISPVPLVLPNKVPPPHELASLHFGEWTLAYQSRPDA